MRGLPNSLVLGVVFLFVSGGCTRGCGPKVKSPAEKKIVVAEIQRIELQRGNGPEATVGTHAVLDYVEMTARGKILRSTRAEKKREIIPVDPAESPPGLGSFVVGMRVGGRRRITVPFGSKYGNADPAGEPVIYEIDLVAVDARKK